MRTLLKRYTRDEHCNCLLRTGSPGAAHCRVLEFSDARLAPARGRTVPRPRKEHPRREAEAEAKPEPRPVGTRLYDGEGDGFSPESAVSRQYTARVSRVEVDARNAQAVQLAPYLLHTDT